MKQTSSLTRELTNAQVQAAERESGYAREVAAEFGFKANVAVRCVLQYPDFAQSHSDNAVEYARIACHYAQKARY